jgi:hypothetical protein
MSASTYAIDVQNYWVMASGTVVNARTYYVAGGSPSGAFQQAHWQGTMWGRSITWHSDVNNWGGDIFERSGSGDLLYLSTFRSNGIASPDSYAFVNPQTWMHASMSVGDTIDTYMEFANMAPLNRNETMHSGRTARTKLDSYYSTYTVPETGVTYSDVILFKYWPDTSNLSSYEQYWCARGLGSIRWTDNPSVFFSAISPGWGTIYGVPVDFGANGYVTGVTLTTPSNPWYSLYMPTVYWSRRTSSILNGTFQNGWTGWTVSSGSATLTTGAGSVPTNPGDRTDVDNAGTQKLAISGSSAGAVITADIIPVTAGQTYRLSGFIYRQYAADNAYIDTNDGHGFNSSGANLNFTNVAAVSSQINNWEYVYADFTVPTGVCGLKVRCVRNNGNVGTAYFDDLRLQLTQ